MSSSAYRSFDDPDQLAAAVRASEVRLVVTGRGGMRASLTRADLGRLWMQSGQISVARISHVRSTPDRVVMMFCQSGGAPTYWQGQQIPPGSVRVAVPGEEGYQRADGAANWASLSLTPDVLAEMGRTLIGADLRPHRSSRLLKPRPEAMRRLAWLHGQIARLAREAPWILTQPEPARSLEHSMIQALMACLADHAPEEDAAAKRRGEAIIARMVALQEMALDTPLHVPEICAAVGVSERTLETHCRTHLGMGPSRYLRLRRLHMARRRLRAAEAGSDSVTRIATSFGFWELGRFAVAYREHFGEAPSTTLHRAPDGAPAEPLWDKDGLRKTHGAGRHRGPGHPAGEMSLPEGPQTGRQETA